MRVVIPIALIALCACNDPLAPLRGPSERDSLFQRTDRVFTDDDGDPRCVDPSDGSNATLDGLLTRGLRQEVDAADCPGDLADCGALLDAIGQNQIEHPFPGAPLRGGALCSPVSKLVAGGYYAALGQPATMGGWCARYGLAPDCQSGDLATALAAEGGPSDLQVSYFNAHALPVSRITLCNQQAGEGFACVNLNFICPERVPGGIRKDAGGLTLAEALCDPGVDGETCAPCEAVSVTMQYDRPRDADGRPVPGSRPVVGFAAYRGVGPDAPLMDRIDLDFSGVEDPHETVPHICNSCHGGVPYAPLDPRRPTLDELDLGAQFLPINPRYALRDKAELFAFLDDGLAFEDALLRDAPLTPLVAEIEAAIVADPNPSSFGVDRARARSDGQPAFRTDLVGGLTVTPGQPARLDLSADLDDTRRINALIRTIDPAPGNDHVLAALDRQFEEGQIVELHRADEIPPDWRGAVDADDYRLIGEHCTDSCHLGLDSDVDFSSYDQFVEHRDSTLFDLCRDYAMPQSPESFNLFWSKSSRVGEASRGDDVEALLTRRFGPDWAPLMAASALDAECPIPPLVFGAALAQPEFTSPQVLRAKARACRAELVAEGGSAEIDVARLRNCRFVCGAEVLGSGFEQSAAITAATCEALVAAGLRGVDADVLDKLRQVRERAGRAEWAKEVLE